MEHSDRKRRARSKPRSCGQIRLIHQTYFLHIEHPHRFTNRRMLNFIQTVHPLCLRVRKLRTVLEKRRQMTDIDIAILIKARGKNRAAILLKIVFHIRSAAEKRHSKWGFCNNQTFFLLSFTPILMNSIHSICEPLSALIRSFPANSLSSKQHKSVCPLFLQKVAQCTPLLFLLQKTEPQT